MERFSQRCGFEGISFINSLWHGKEIHEDINQLAPRLTASFVVSSVIADDGSSASFHALSKLAIGDGRLIMMTNQQLAAVQGGRMFCANPNHCVTITPGMISAQNGDQPVTIQNGKIAIIKDGVTTVVPFP
jgi:hypothetical protein